MKYKKMAVFLILTVCFCLLLVKRLARLQDSGELASQNVRIICWGDSLTEGTGGDGTSYPQVLQALSGLEVLNYGVSGETAECIACRQGASSLFLRQDIIIPAESVPVALDFTNAEGEHEGIFWEGDAGINPCTIEGVEGTLEPDSESDGYLFTRSQPGGSVAVQEHTKLHTFAMDDRRDTDILIIDSGTNDAPDAATIEQVIAEQQEMIAYAGTGRYVVIGMTANEYMPDIAQVNHMMAEAYGEHFLDLREYILKGGYMDAGIAMTEADKKDIESGSIPRSLRSDAIHGNEHFYRIMGEQVYQKLLELRYIKAG